MKENKSDRLKQLFKELGRLLNMTSHFLIIGTFTSEKLDLSDIFRNQTINVQNSEELTASYFLDSQISLFSKNFINKTLS